MNVEELPEFKAYRAAIEAFTVAVDADESAVNEEVAAVAAITANPDDLEAKVRQVRAAWVARATGHVCMAAETAAHQAKIELYRVYEGLFQEDLQNARAAFEGRFRQRCN